jgi:DNA repair protein RadD
MLERGVPKAVVLLNRDKLVEQTARRLVHLNPTVWAAGQGSKNASGNVVICSLQSCDRLTIPDCRLIICDEAHNINEEGRYGKFFERHPKAKILGFTATPWRHSILIYGDGEFFPEINFRRGIKEMIDAGWICRPIAKAQPHAWDTSKLKTRMGEFETKDVERMLKNWQKIKAQIEDAMPKLEGRRKVVWVCSSIDHAERVRQFIPEESVLIHSKSLHNEYSYELFEKGPIRHLVSIMMVTEGYDFPAIDAICFMRPTKSPTLMVQVIGRGLRLSPGKTDCLVLDYGRVIENCGPITSPYLREHRLDKTKPEEELKACPKCLSYMERFETSCPDCGYEFPPTERDMEKSLDEESAERDILEFPDEEFNITDVLLRRHRGPKGDCLRIDYITDRLYPKHVSVYGTSYFKYWPAVRAQLKEMTGWDCPSYIEALELVDNGLVPERIPSKISAERAGKHYTLKKVYFDERERDRVEDIDVPF